MLARSRSGDTDRFEIRVTEPALPSDESRLLLEPNQYEYILFCLFLIYKQMADIVVYRGEVEPESPAGMVVMEAMAFVNGSNSRQPGNITYFMEPSDDDLANSLTAIKDWFRMDNRTGVVRLLKSPPPDAKTRNVTFTIVARERDKSLETRAPATVLFHGLPSTTTNNRQQIGRQFIHF